MATSSITANVSISTTEQAERLISAFEACASSKIAVPKCKNAVLLSDHEKIRALIAKRKHTK